VTYPGADVKNSNVNVGFGSFLGSATDICAVCCKAKTGSLRRRDGSDASMTIDDKPEFDKYAGDYTRIIDDYISFGGQSQEFYTRAKADQLRRLVAATPSAEPIEILDVGCGHGLIHPFLRDPNYRLTGVDVAGEAIRLARQTNPEVIYETYDGRRLPYPDARFDVVFTICVLHHVPVEQWPAFVAEMRRVLRPGGRVVIFEHNKLNPAVLWVVSRIPIDRDAVLLTSWRTRSLVRDAGFQEIACRHILFFPLDAPRLRAFEERLGWLPMGAQYYVTARKPVVQTSRRT
jgi:SAM-dependent methyltransferase